MVSQTLTVLWHVMWKTASCNLCLLLNLQFSQGDRKMLPVGSKFTPHWAHTDCTLCFEVPCKIVELVHGPHLTREVIWYVNSQDVTKAGTKVASSMFEVNTLCSGALTAISSLPSPLLAVMSLLWVMVSPSVTIMNWIPDGSSVLRKWSCIPGCYQSLLERQEMMSKI